jgi:hypothetical protein
MSETGLHVEVEVNPTEDVSKVKAAVENVFGPLEFEERPRSRGSFLIASSQHLESLSRFGTLLRRERIRAAARRVLLQGVAGDTITFYLNKQVASAGHISFSEAVAESPLGPIKVQIRSPNPPKLINRLAPRTT